MNPFQAGWQGALGWRDLLAQRESWREHFDQTFSGMVRAIYVYLIVVALNIAVQLAGAALMALIAIAANDALNLLPLIGLMASVVATALVLRLRSNLHGLLVPAIHGLALAVLAGIPLSAIGVPAGPVVLALLGYMMFRLARAAAGLDLRVSIAFAALCIVVLVALPLSLYMVIAPGPGPI